MKYQKILGLVATAGLLLAGCATDSDNSNTWLSDPNAVHVSASVGSIFTRSNPTDEAKQTSFNKDDVMGVSNNGKSLNYTFNGTDWQPGSGSYLVWDDNNLKFQCWYPADGKNTFSKGYIQDDQSSAEAIAKSDYMTAEKKLDAIPGDRQLKVAMERKTARLIFNIESFNDQFDASTTKVNHIRIASKASTDAGETSIINIKPLQSGEGGINTTYTALVAPGEVEGKLYFSAEGTTETPLVVKTGALEAGKSYTYNLIVGKNKIAINDITVKDWATGEITDGKAEEAIPYVTFTAAGEQIFKMITESSSNGPYGENEPYKISGLEYSVNNNDVWKKVVENEEVTFGGNNNGTLRLRGKNIAGTAKDGSNYATITFDNPDVKVTCTGDIRTLLDHESYKTVATDQARFCYLFYNCKAMTTAPNLPAETLADECYRRMFANCKNLVKAPALPAKTLTEFCYESMFEGCTSLKTAPELPATTLADYCYRSMFSDCRTLDTAPTLSVETLANSCYSTMFKGCTSLKTAPVLPAKSLKNYCYSKMFLGCTSLENAPALHATVLAENCYSNMFENCTSLESAPELPATKLAEYCYKEMFKGCAKLSSVTMLAPSDQIRKNFNCCLYWLNDAGTNDGITRTLIVLDEDAYNMFVNKNYLPASWKKDATNTTVENYTPKP